MNSFGQIVKELRLKRRASQRQLARQAGITPAYLSDIENSKRNAPPKPLIQKMAFLLGVDEKFLFDLAGDAPNRIPPDIPEIIKRHPESVGLLRAIHQHQLSDKRVRELTKRIGGSTVKAIILGAGLGSRMKHMTANLPKFMAITFKGQTLLQTQLAALKSCGIRDISMVKGYCAEKINYPNIRYYLNDNYAHNNILESLFYAEAELDADVIVSYADIWYEPEVVRRLSRCEQDIAIGVDIDWKDYYLGRKDHPLDEAENVIFDSDGNVIKIGKIAAEKEEVHGEFIGIMKLTRRGCEMIKRHYHRAAGLYAGKPFQRAKLFQRAYLTDLLQEMTDLGVPIHCEIIGSAWKEIDTIEDFENAVKFFEKRPLFSTESSHSKGGLK